MPDRGTSRATTLGILAILLWSSSVAFIRTLSEKLGPVSTIAWAYLLGGVVSLAAAALTPGGLSRFRRLPRSYLWGCGSLFVVYSTCYCLAVGLAASRLQVITVGLVNYLWPSLTLLLGVPLLGHRARWYLVPGMLLASAGMVLATVPQGTLSVPVLWANVVENAWPYALALVGAVAWALYSNLARRLGAEDGGVPLFILASGLVILPLRFFFPGPGRWDARVIGELLYLVLFVTLAAYVFWDHAMRKGNIVLVAALSYFTPLLSTAFSAAYLGVAPGPFVWVACGLLILGAFLCRLAVRENGSV